MPIIAAALLTSAFLLFWIQPLYAKVILPVLGGTPAVWNTTMVFFQAMLVLGYSLAHLIRLYIPIKAQPYAHIALTVLALLQLPPSFSPPADLAAVAGAPVSWLLLALWQNVGLLAIALAMNTPLLQHYFAQSQHKGSEKPYVLYAASNTGSLAALLLFPLALEPLLSLSDQKLVWAGGFGILVVLLLVNALRWKPKAATQHVATAAPIPLARYALWLALAAVPSGLMLGVTNHITTDVASAPLFWVVPLALYLLTFIIAFASGVEKRQQGYTHFSYLAILLTALVVLNLAWRFSIPIAGAILLHITTFFVLAVLLHARLASLAPDPYHLTRYFMTMSIGGLIGGTLVSVLVPLLTNAVYEYPLFLGLAVLLLPLYGATPFSKDKTERRHGLLFCGLSVLVVLSFSWNTLGNKFTAQELAVMLVAIGLLTALITARNNDRTFQAIAMMALMSAGFYHISQKHIQWQGRSFYGVVRVYDTPERNIRHFLHGTTLHGQQYLDDERRLQPLTYYHPEGDYGKVLAEIVRDKPAAHIGFAGLGAAASTCYGTADATYTFFEIDPMVAHVAIDTGLFSYWQDCPSTKALVLGDARLTLAEQPDGHFDALFLDAFSSDAIPMHLLTLEAMQMYAQKMRPDGVLIYHISNRYLDLAPQLFQQAQMMGFEAYVNNASPSDNPDVFKVVLVAIMMPERAAPPAHDTDGVVWQRYQASAYPHLPRVWRDDFANILSAFRR